MIKTELTCPHCDKLLTPEQVKSLYGRLMVSRRKRNVAGPGRPPRKKCVHCDQPSLPGLKPGQGLCQYHWDVATYGKEWADRVRDQATAPAE